jgi:hypothetical protein
MYYFTKTSITITSSISKEQSPDPCELTLSLFIIV